MPTVAEKPTTSRFLYKDPEFSFQALRILGAAPGGFADIGECLMTLAAIEEGNEEQWHTAWYKLARRIENNAATWASQNHDVSARTAYLRAANYYRTAEFFLHGNPQDPRILKTWGKSRDCFRAAAKRLIPPVVPIQVPFEGTTLPGYLCLVDASETPRPLVIVATGFDGTSEELYPIAAAALQRGFHCLLMEGPGQGGVIREQKIPFRPNWETAVTPFVDYALTLKQVDSKRMALMGLSMGGYLIPRALAFEHRVKVGIANGGVYDFHAVCLQGNGNEIEAHLDDPSACKEIDLAILEMMKTTPTLRWSLNHGMYVFSAKTPTEFMRMTRPYHLRDVAKNIEAKMLIVDCDHELHMAGQASQLFNALCCPKEFLLFTTEEGAGEHCQIGALMLSNERLFNWLEDNL